MRWPLSHSNYLRKNIICDAFKAWCLQIVPRPGLPPSSRSSRWGKCSKHTACKSSTYHHRLQFASSKLAIRCNGSSSEEPGFAKGIVDHEEWYEHSWPGARDLLPSRKEQGSGRWKSAGRTRREKDKNRESAWKDFMNIPCWSLVPGTWSMI